MYVEESFNTIFNMGYMRVKIQSNRNVYLLLVDSEDFALGELDIDAGRYVGRGVLDLPINFMYC